MYRIHPIKTIGIKYRIPLNLRMTDRTTRFLTHQCTKSKTKVATKNVRDFV